MIGLTRHFLQTVSVRMWIVRPRQQLRDHLITVVPTELADVLLETTILFGGNFGSYFGEAFVRATAEFWRQVQLGRQAFVKLAFLSRLHSDYFVDRLTEFKRIFDTDRISAQLFDRWWTLEQSSEDIDLNDIKPDIAQVRSLIDSDDFIVNDCLSHCRPTN